MTDLWGRVSGYRFCPACGAVNPADAPECAWAEYHDGEDSA